MNNLDFRRLMGEDMDEWFRLRIKGLEDVPTAFLASPETELAQGVEFFRDRVIEGGDFNVIFGCFDGARLVGTIGIVREHHIKASHKAFIWGMYVDSEYRGKKIGKKCLELAIAHAKKVMKVRIVTLSVETTRKPAKALYESLGFEKWGVEKNALQYQGQFYDEEYMALDLNTYSQ